MPDSFYASVREALEEGRTRILVVFSAVTTIDVTGYCPIDPRQPTSPPNLLGVGPKRSAVLIAQPKCRLASSEAACHQRSGAFDIDEGARHLDRLPLLERPTLISQEAGWPEVNPAWLALASTQEMDAFATLTAIDVTALLKRFQPAVMRLNGARIIVDRRPTVMVPSVVMAMSFSSARRHKQSTSGE